MASRSIIPANSSTSFQRFLDFHLRQSRECSLAGLPEYSGGTTDISGLSPDVSPEENGTLEVIDTGHDQEPDFKLNGEIVKIRKLLECPVCYEVILPPIILCESGHSVCNPCKENLQNCPTCRGNFSKIRNRFAEEFLEKCLVKCRFHESGCQLESSGGVLSAHIKDCNYRPLKCWGCDVLISYHEFIDHLNSEDHMGVHRTPELSTEFPIPDDFLEPLEPDDERYAMWPPVWIHAFGQDFFCFLENLSYHWWIWVGGYTVPEKRENIVCSITVWNEELKTENQYKGPVQSIRATSKQVWESGYCLPLSHSQVMNILKDGKLQVLFKIHPNRQIPHSSGHEQ